MFSQLYSILSGLLVLTSNIGFMDNLFFIFNLPDYGDDFISSTEVPTPVLPDFIIDKMPYREWLYREHFAKLVVMYPHKYFLYDDSSMVEELSTETGYNTLVSYIQYLEKFQKTYDHYETVQRYQYFKENLREISELRKLQPEVYGLTIFSDMSNDEFRNTKLGHGKWTAGGCSNKNFTHCPAGSTDEDRRDTVFGPIPQSWDWRDQGVVRPILNQKSCMACWAFSIVGLMESMAAIQKISSLQALSIQEVYDCSYYTGDSRKNCNEGRVVSEALRYMCSEKLMVTTENEYPLKLVLQECHRPSHGLRLKSLHVACDMDEQEILRLLYYHGPLGTVVDARTWKHYSKGIIWQHCEGPIDHAVQIVGYDRSGDEPYYIVKNSWGKEFGEDGYVRIGMGRKLCSIAKEIFYFEVI